MTTLPIPAPEGDAAAGRHLPSVVAQGPTPSRKPAVPTGTTGPAPVPARRGRLARRDDDRGQATAEYGLVILVAGLIALGVIAWARGTGSFTDMFENIITTLTSAV
jgi:Flp pilus assembly pilin Flp